MRSVKIKKIKKKTQPESPRLHPGMDSRGPSQFIGWPLSASLPSSEIWQCPQSISVQCILTPASFIPSQLPLPTSPGLGCHVTMPLCYHAGLLTFARTPGPHFLPGTLRSRVAWTFMLVCMLTHCFLAPHLLKH